jgi:ABC-type microcin C transport system duplicated ATPase subunit YejF
MANPSQKLLVDPVLDAQRIRADDRPLLKIDALTVSFVKPAGLADVLRLAPPRRVHAVTGVSLTVQPGETLALVGESGSGKTTLARSILGLVRTNGGRICFEGQDLTTAGAGELKAARRRIAMMFQDPFGSLSPRMRVGDIVTEPLRIGRARVADWSAEAARLLRLVGLPLEFASRYPHELSGGQARRVGVARALAVTPALLIADEPTAGLDVSVQGEIVNLLMSLREELGMSLLIITHNLHVVRHISDRVAVMYGGVIIEANATDRLFAEPLHPYTRKLLAANLNAGVSSALARD